MGARSLFISALPPYAGGKRRLLGAIFRDLPAAADAPVLIDAFMGGGAVALTAKARGYRVRAGDIAERSAVIGRALIENSSVTLSPEDLVRLAVPQTGRTFARDHQAPDTFPATHAAFMDDVLANAEDLAGPKRWLAKLLVVKMALRCRPMGNFGAKRIMQQAAAGEWEGMNPHYVKDLVTRGVARHPLRMAEELRQQINRGVFSNGYENRVHQVDATELLKSVQGDIAYLDPPYAGTSAYETALRPLDELLAGRRLEVEKSRFSTGEPEEVLPPLLEAADHIPNWVISYGNARCDLGELMDIVRRYRPRVEGRAIAYKHMTGLASEEAKARNRELLVVARRQ